MPSYFHLRAPVAFALVKGISHHSLLGFVISVLVNFYWPGYRYFSPSVSYPFFPSFVFLPREIVLGQFCQFFPLPDSCVTRLNR